MKSRIRRSGITITSGLTIVTLIALAARPAGAQQFSADVVNTPQKGSMTTRVYVGNSRMRLQTYNGGQPEGGMIWDGPQNSTIIVMDKERSYIGGNSPLLTAAFRTSGAPVMVRIFKPIHSGDPCTDWNAAVLPYADSTRPQPHFTCRSEGSDAVNGRAAQKWFVLTTQGSRTDSGYAWIDSRLHVVSRSQDRDGSIELRNIQEGPQPDAEFRVPAGYHQVDARALLMQLQGGTAAIADMFGSAAKDVGTDAANSTVDEAKQKTSDAVKKKIKGLFHFP